MPACVGVSGYEHLVGGQFGGAIEIYGTASLVSREGNYTLHASVNTRVNEVHCPIDISLDTLKRVVFRNWNNFGGGGVNYVIDTLQCPI